MLRSMGSTTGRATDWRYPYRSASLEALVVGRTAPWRSGRADHVSATAPLSTPSNARTDSARRLLDREPLRDVPGEVLHRRIGVDEVAAGRRAARARMRPGCRDSRTGSRLRHRGWACRPGSRAFRCRRRATAPPRPVRARRRARRRARSRFASDGRARCAGSCRRAAQAVAVLVAGAAVRFLSQRHLDRRHVSWQLRSQRRLDGAGERLRRDLGRIHQAGRRGRPEVDDLQAFAEGEGQRAPVRRRLDDQARMLSRHDQRVVEAFVDQALTPRFTSPKSRIIPCASGSPDSSMSHSQLSPSSPRWVCRYEKSMTVRRSTKSRIMTE